MDPGRYVLELAHGRARQVSDYQALRRDGAPSCVDYGGRAEAVVQAQEWFGGSKRRLLAPFVVGTVDQAPRSELARCGSGAGCPVVSDAPTTSQAQATGRLHRYRVAPVPGHWLSLGHNSDPWRRPQDQGG